MCERSEWELLLKTKRKDIPNDRKLINKLWKKYTYFDQEMFCDEYSNHHNFKKLCVLSPIQCPVDFSVPMNLLSTGEIYSLFPYFSGVK